MATQTAAGCLHTCVQAPGCAALGGRGSQGACTLVCGAPGLNSSAKGRGREHSVATRLTPWCCAAAHTAHWCAAPGRGSQRTAAHGPVVSHEQLADRSLGWRIHQGDTTRRSRSDPRPVGSRGAWKHPQVTSDPCNRGWAAAHFLVVAPLLTCRQQVTRSARDPLPSLTRARSAFFRSRRDPWVPYTDSTDRERPARPNALLAL